MNGEIAQMVALVSHGSRFLHGPDDSTAPELFPLNSTFRFVHDVTFEPGGTGTRGWFEELRHQGVAQLSLYLAGRNPTLAAFANGAESLILAKSSDARVWASSWRPTPKQGPDNRIWSVKYKAFESDCADVPMTDVDEARAELSRWLSIATDFAQQDDFLRQFVEYFARATAQLDAAAPVLGNVPDLVPDRWAWSGRCLLAAASDAWVFGGMGSWNDAVFGDDEMHRRYHEVSAGLYDAVRFAIAAGANAESAPEPT